MHDWYDWLKDIGLPLLTGGGSVVVGAVAIYVARRSHELAMQVRADEAKRDADAARERYRSQMVELAESAMTALMELATEMNARHLVETATDRNLRAIVNARLQFIDRIANEDDRRIARAIMRELRITRERTESWFVRTRVTGQLAAATSYLVSEDRDMQHVLDRIASFTDDALARQDAAQEPSSPDDDD